MTTKESYAREYPPQYPQHNSELLYLQLNHSHYKLPPLYINISEKNNTCYMYISLKLWVCTTKSFKVVTRSYISNKFTNNETSPQNA